MRVLSARHNHYGGKADMIRILSDSTCDLTEALLKRYNVDVVPLQILLGDKNYEDGCGITPKDIFRWSDENKATPKTAAARVRLPCSTTLISILYLARLIFLLPLTIL